LSSADDTVRTVTVHVGFSLHVFTCEFANANPGAEKYRDDREYRAFDHERYRASLHLGSLIRELEARRCYFARNGNFFTAEQTCAPPGHEYRVFFTLRRDKTSADTVTLVVQSAYFRRMDWGRRDLPSKPVAFRVIISNTLSGKPLREPP
jgi:hypothetical protein